MSEKLGDFLKTGKKGSTLRSSTLGVFVLKLPEHKTSPTRLVVELNPVNERGNPKKRRGLILRSSDQLENFVNFIQYEKLPKPLSIINSINPKVEAVRLRKEV